MKTKASVMAVIAVMEDELMYVGDIQWCGMVDRAKGEWLIRVKSSSVVVVWIGGDDPLLVLIWL